MLNFVESIDATVVERIVYGFPAVAKAMEDAPPAKWWVALEAAEASYIGTLPIIGLFGRCFASFGSLDHSAFERSTGGRPTYGR
jgi:hypothetical protein